MWRRTRASSTLGIINGELRRRMAADDIPGLIADIQQLAQTAGLIRADDPGLQQVVINFGQAIEIVIRRGSLSQFDATIVACQRAASGTPSPLLKATFQALLGNLFAGKFAKTEDMADLDAATSAFQQAADTAPDSNPIKAVYIDRLAKLRSMSAGLAATAREGELQERLGDAASASSPAPEPHSGITAPKAADSGGQPSQKVLDFTDPEHLPPGWTPKQVREATEFFGEPQTGDLIPREERHSRKFRWHQRGLLLWCLACTGTLIFAWLHGGTFVDTGDAIVATLGSWLVFLFACFGIVFKRPG